MVSASYAAVPVRYPVIAVEYRISHDTHPNLRLVRSTYHVACRVCSYFGRPRAAIDAQALSTSVATETSDSKPVCCISAPLSLPRRPPYPNSGNVLWRPACEAKISG